MSKIEEFKKKLDKMDIDKEYIYWLNDMDSLEHSVTFLKLLQIDSIRLIPKGVRRNVQEITFNGDYLIFNYEEGKLVESWGSEGYTRGITLAEDNLYLNLDIISKKDIPRLMALIALEKNNG